MRSQLDFEKTQKTSLTEEVDGLQWKVQELSEVQQDLEEARNNLFKVETVLKVQMLLYYSPLRD